MESAGSIDPKGEVAGGCESGKRRFSELTVVFRNMLVHFDTGD
jgi:hypothetical protein